MTSPTIVGIDLGTTFSALAVMGEHGAEIVPNAEGRPTTPSIVYADPDGTVLVGDEAGQAAVGDRENAMMGFKRDMGTTTKYSTGSRTWTPVELSALVLGTLKDAGTARLGWPVERSVITIPAYFDDHARLATREAAKLAGLEACEMIHEPTAAALAYGLADHASDRTVLVYDLGGGTFDVSIVRLAGDSTRVIGTLGDFRLGGVNWDAVLVELVAEQFITRHGVDPRLDASAAGVLRSAAEQGKRRLSVRDSATISLSVAGFSDEVEITRTEFESATSHLIRRTGEALRSVLEDVRLSAAEIDEVVLVGGSTRMPACEALIVRMLGKTPRKNINPDEAIALGAAVRGAMLGASQSAGGLVRRAAEPDAAAADDGERQLLFSLPGELVDVTAHALGFVTVSESGDAYVNDVMVPRLTKLPVRVRRPKHYDPGVAGEDLVVHLLQGDSREPIGTTALGRYTFEGVGRLVARPSEIDIIFGYDNDGVVTIEAEIDHRPIGAPTVDRDDLDLSWTLDDPREASNVVEVSAMLVLDCSGSMSDSDKRQAVDAGLAFVDQLGGGRVGVIAWGSTYTVLCDPTDDLVEVRSALRAVVGQSLGGTTLAPTLLESVRLLEGKGGRYVVVLTDGGVGDAPACMEARAVAVESGVDIVGVGIGAANEAFLRSLSTVEYESFLTGLNDLARVFRGIAQDISSGKIGSIPKR